jgi:carboxyl-terminal processing protease
MMTGRAAVARAQDPYAHLDLFARVLTTIERDYVEEIGADVLVDAAIRGMVGVLDDQSRWLDEDQVRELRDDAEGAVTGLGIEVGPGHDGVEIVRVAPDSPASRDGLAEGDTIVSIDGQPLSDLDLDEIRARFAGDRGETTTLTVLREGWAEPKQITTVRDRVHRTSVSGERLGEVVYARLSQFSEGAARDLRAEVEHLAGPDGVAGLDGLVLDLRDDPGGLLSEAVAVSDLFLDEGPIVSTRGRGGAEDAVYPATVGGFPPSLQVVVLVNGMSASASEIVAGALQDTGRGVLVGERTYGKGTVQQVFLHADPEEAALKLTVGRYYTPSGEPVAREEGREPDHVVPFPRPSTSLDALRGRLIGLPEEAELLALLDEVAEDLPERSSGRAVIPWDRTAAQRLPDDPQLAKALELLSSP